MTVSKKSMKWIPWILILPVVIIRGFTTLYPILVTIKNSFYDIKILAGIDEFVGLANYADVLGSAAFRLAFYNTFRFLLLGVPLLMAVSLWLACMVNGRGRAKQVFRSIFLYPMVLPVASVVMFFQVFLAERGILNSLLTLMGLPSVGWLDSETSFGVLIFLYIWKNCGFCVILFTAGLANIPEQYYESARLDGASKLKTVTKISLPLITPTAFFAFLMAVIYSFKIFREVFVLFGDYPDENVYFLQNFINNNFKSLNFAHLSSASIVFSIFLILLLLVFFIFERKRNFLE